MKLIPYISVLPLLVGCTLVAQSISDQELIERLKVNRTLFEKWDHGPNLREEARQTDSDVAIKPMVFETPVICTSCTASDPTDEPVIEAATGQSDLVVTGTVVRNIAALTKNHSFVVTDSEFVISDVWKASPKLEGPPKSGDEITVANPGGTVILDGHKISAYPSNLVPLQSGRTYLLFLRYVPASHSYINAGLDGFDITNAQVVPLHQNVPPPAASLIKDRDRFVSALHSSTAKAIEREGR